MQARATVFSSFMIVLILFFALQQMSVAQIQQKLDSLELSLKLPADDTTRINQLNALCYYNYSSNPDKGLEYGIKGRDLSIQVNWQKGLTAAYSDIGCCYYTKSAYTDAVTNWLLALRIAEAIGEPVSGIIGNIGNVYADLGDLHKALENYERADRSPEFLNGRKVDFAQVIWLDENIGTTLVALERYAEAKQRFLKVLSLSKDPATEQYTAVACAGYSECLVYEHRLDSALYYAELAVDRATHSDDPALKAYTYLGVGRVYYTLVQSQLYRHYELKKNINAGTLLSSARRFADSSAILYRVLQSRGQLLPVLQLKASVFELQGHADSALSYFRQYLSLKDSLMSMRQSQQLAELNFGFDQEKRDVVTQKNLERQTLQRNGFIGGFVMVLLFLVVVASQRKRIKQEKFKTEELLHNVLPPSIAKRMLGGENVIADKYQNVSILFADIVGFTKLSQQVSAEVLVQSLDKIFSSFDVLAQKYGLEKIKTIGDAYMVIAGAPEHQPHHALAMSSFAFDVMESLKQFNDLGLGNSINLRVGIHCGEVVAGVIGKNKFAYDMWGDAVNTAARMESHGEAGRIHVSEAFYRAVTTPPQPSPEGEGATSDANSLKQKMSKALPSGEGLGGVLSRGGHRAIPNPPQPSPEGEGARSDDNTLEQTLRKALPSGEGLVGVFSPSGIHFTPRGEIEIKGKGLMHTYFLEKA